MLTSTYQNNLLEIAERSLEADKWLPGSTPDNLLAGRGRETWLEQSLNPYFSTPEIPQERV